MPSPSRLPLKVVIGLVLAIVIDTVLQIVWKFAALRVPPDAHHLASLAPLLGEPLFWAVGILLVLQLANWMSVLDKADLSYAQPITALSYISVLTASALILHEDVTPRKIAGVCVVFVGVWLISRTDHRTDTLGEVQP